MNNTQATIETFILNDLLSGSRDRLDPDESLISTGVIDSLGMLRLISFLEESFNIKVNDGDVLDTNFDSLNKIAAFVEKQKTVS